MANSRNEQNRSTPETLIDFMARFANSEQFNKVFQEGMDTEAIIRAALKGSVQ